MEKQAHRLYWQVCFTSSRSIVSDFLSCFLPEIVLSFFRMFGIFIYKLMLSWKAPWKNLQPMKYSGSVASANGQKNKLCSALIGWLDFRTLGNVAGFWFMLHMSKWKALGMFDLFLSIYVKINLIDVSVKCHGVKPWCRCGIYHNKQPIGVSPNLQGWSSHGISQVELQGSGRHFFCQNWRRSEWGKSAVSGRWFQVFCIFTPKPWGNDPIWRSYFSGGLKTTNQVYLSSKTAMLFFWIWFPEMEVWSPRSDPIVRVENISMLTVCGIYGIYDLKGVILSWRGKIP